MIEIEKNVPIIRNQRGVPSKYPWSSMEVGDSFFVRGAKITTMSHARHDAGKRTGFTFISRTVEGGVRVWRTA